PVLLRRQVQRVGTRRLRRPRSGGAKRLGGTAAERPGVHRLERLVRHGELRLGIAPAPVAVQPFAVEQPGAAKLWRNRAPLELLDRRQEQLVGARPTGNQRSGAVKAAAGPGGVERAGDLLE